MRSIIYFAYNIFIEIDGDQYRIPIALWGGEEGLKNTQERDQLKEMLAKSIGATVRRSVHTDNDRIESLKSELTSYLTGIKAGSKPSQLDQN